MLSAFVSSFFARSPNYGLTNCAFSGNIYRQPVGLQKKNMGVFPSGQWGQTVNLLLSASVVRIHPRPPRTPVSESGTGVSVLSALQKGTQGWIRTASTRRTVRREKKPLRGFFRCAARVIHPRPPNKKNPNLFPIGEGFGFFVFFGYNNEGSRGWRKTPMPCHRP